MALQITDADFESVIKDNSVVVIDFWAQWCGPCKMVGPIIDELAKDYSDKAVVGKIDVDSNPTACVEYGIRNLPAILFFKDGVMVDRQIGAVTKTVLSNKLNAIL